MKENTDYESLVGFRDLVNDSFGIILNANDFFHVACADTLVLEVDDLVWVMPIYVKYGFAGLDAVMSYIAGRNPLAPHMTDKFKEAYAEIKELKPEVYSEY